MFNSRLLYLPNEEKTLDEILVNRQTINPIFHSDFSKYIPESFSHGYPTNKIFQKFCENFAEDCPNFGNCLKNESKIIEEVLLPEKIQRPTKIHKSSCIKGDTAGELSRKEIRDKESSLPIVNSNKLVNDIGDATNSEGRRNSKNLKLSEKSDESLPKIRFVKGSSFEEDKDYERKNVFYKTILRDFRKFLANDFDSFLKKFFN